ncbi:MAG: DUF5680 domain-containing protein [Candidatus ainarchaeum sp.]|nr:DUF5680 domain-containing protein [Candidatus ainarchaeum sp.]
MLKQEINLKKLANFIVQAKKNTYASTNIKEIKSERSGFKELEYRKNNFYYRDSYSGFFNAPGQEIVRIDNHPVWAMAYSGGMIEKLHENTEFALQTFNFLKKCLLKISIDKPYRGPDIFKEKEWKYTNKLTGNIKNFSGLEKIYYNDKLVFRQNYIGGLIINKE